MPRELEPYRIQPKKIAVASSIVGRRIYLRWVAPVIGFLAVAYVVLLVGKGTGWLNLTYESITEFKNYAWWISLMCTGVVSPELAREIMNFYYSLKD